MARVRPHIKVHISVADHRKTAAVWADLAMRGMLVELWRKAGEKFAGRTADRVSLKPTDRMDIAATTDQAEADRAVTGLCSALKYELRTYPNRWDVRIRKFSKKQGFQQEELSTKADGLSQELSPPIPIPNPIPIPTPKEEGSTPASRTPRAKSASTKTLCPDQLSDEQRQAVTAWAADQGIDPATLKPEWQKHRLHWQSKGELRVKWDASFEKWLLKSREIAARDAVRDGGLSRGEAREREQDEAAREAFRRSMAREGDDSPPLLALAGGRS